MSVRRSKGTKSKTSPRKSTRGDARTSRKLPPKHGYTFDEYKEVEKGLSNQYEVYTGDSKKFIETVDIKIKPKIPNMYTKRSAKVQYVIHGQGNAIIVDGVVFADDPSSALLPAFSRYMDDYIENINVGTNPKDYYFWKTSLYNLHKTERIRKGGYRPSSGMPVSNTQRDIERFEHGMSAITGVGIRLRRKRDTFKKSSDEYKMLNKMAKSASAEYERILVKHVKSEKMRENRLEQARKKFKKEWKGTIAEWKKQLDPMEFTHQEMNYITR